MAGERARGTGFDALNLFKGLGPDLLQLLQRAGVLLGDGAFAACCGRSSARSSPSGAALPPGFSADSQVDAAVAASRQCRFLHSTALP